jgi:hypothetical protein
MEAHKVIFIDMDGVLNHNHHTILEPSLLSLFGAMVRKMNASLVLSTAWRLRKDSRELVEIAFLQHAIPLPISCTPCIDGPRPNEIIAWLHMNTVNVFQESSHLPPRHLFRKGDDHFSEKHYHLPIKIYCSSFVAIDDLDFFSPQRGGPYRELITKGHFVKTLMSHGLTKENVEEVEINLSSLY